MKYDILAIGTLYVDIISTQFPFSEKGLTPESDTLGEDYTIALGGSVPNFARVMSSLGLKALVIGKAGQDYMSELFAKMAVEAGIQTDLIIDPNSQTSLSINFVNQEGRTIITGVGDANNNLKAGEIKGKFLANIANTRYFYIGSFLKIPEYKRVALELIDIAHQHNVKIILDHGRIHNRVVDKDFTILNQAFSKLGEGDFYFPNRHELLKVSERSTIEEAIEYLQTSYKMRVVAKIDKEGAIAYENSQILKVPTFGLKPINTIGAGDSFNAGFIKAQEMGLGLAEAMRFANATASLKISKSTPPTAEEVSSLLSHGN